MTWWWSRPRIGRGELDRCAYHGLADDLPDPPKNRSTAFALSAGGTALSIGLVAAGATTHNGPMLAAGLLGSLALRAAVSAR